MNKIWHRGVSKYLEKEGLATKHIHSDVVVILVDDTPALLKMQSGHLNLGIGRESFEDDSMPG